MAYAFTISDNAVFVVHSATGYREVIQDVVQVTSYIPTATSTDFIISIYRKYNKVPLQITRAEIDTIDGVAPSATLATLLAQFNTMFKTAVAGIY